MRILPRPFTTMFFVLPLRDRVIVTPANPMFGHGFPAPESAWTDPSGQNSNDLFAVNVVPGHTYRIAPPLFGPVSRLLSAPVDLYVCRDAVHRFVYEAATIGAGNA